MTERDLQGVVAPLRAAGVAFSVLGRSIVVPDEGQSWVRTLAQCAGVESIDEQRTPYKLTARAARPEGTEVRVGPTTIGGPRLAVIAGPCAIESRDQLRRAAEAVASAGANALRGGAYKPRTSPYAFQGLGREGLELLAEVGAAVGLPTVTEVMAPEDVAVAAQYADMLQVGARNVQNFPLLHALGAQERPVLLKRGMATTLEELLLAAEYVVAGGNPNVVLCERGIRTFETATRNTLDLGAVAALREMTHLPVIVDPSHAAGRRSLVGPLARAAVATGADGLIVEVHPDPGAARCDGAQSLAPEAFDALMLDVVALAAQQGRTTASPDDGLSAHRRRIDGIDALLVRLLDERASISQAIGKIKHERGEAVEVPEREAEVLRRAREASRGPLDGPAIERVLTTIMSEMRALEVRSWM